MLLRQLFVIVALIMAPGSVADVNAASAVTPQAQEELERDELYDYVLSLTPKTEEEEWVIRFAISLLEDESADESTSKGGCPTGGWYPTPGTGISWGSCNGKLKTLTICIAGTCKSWK